MDDLEIALLDAWHRNRQRILSDPAELQRRLARRRSNQMLRPPRAWCLAVRASDTRIDPCSFGCVPEGAAYPARYRADHSTAEYAEHTVTLTAAGLRKICRPIRIEPPGQEVEEVAELLGCSRCNLRYAMWKGIFKVHYVRGLGGKRGKPVPLLYADRLFDPSAGHIASRPDPIWGTIWQGLANLLPNDFEQTVSRIPVYWKRNGRPFDPDGPCRQRQSLRMPPPPPDYVWYKQKDGQFVDPCAKYRRRCSRRKSEIENQEPKAPAPTFSGWRWLCPACKKAVRSVYYPLPPFTLLDFLGEKIPVHEADELQPPPPTFACRRCHNICFFSSIASNGWNHLVCHLSGGLLYGYEVPKPKTFVPQRRREYVPRINRAPSRRRQQVLDLLVAGRARSQISDDLGIRPSTVNRHIEEIFRQHRVHSRAELCERLGAPKPLTFRRQQVVQCLLAGHSYKRIAAELDSTLVAVDHQIGRIYRHYGVHCRAELLAALSGSPGACAVSPGVSKNELRKSQIRRRSYNPPS